MDVYKAIQELLEEKARLDAAIRALESRIRHLEAPAVSTPRVRRGRRSMSEREREEVSRRMSTYWATRRAQKQGAISAAGGGYSVN